MSVLRDFEREQEFLLLQGQVKEHKRVAKELRLRNLELVRRLDLLQTIDAITLTPPRWAHRKPSGAIHRAIPTLLLSDCHWDEVVNPDEVEGANAYNREIAVKRLKRVLENTVMVARRYVAGLQFEGFVLFLGGDCLSGNIHEELVETNDDTLFGSLDYWADQLAAFVTGLADEFGKLHIAGVVGNHGRLSRKPRAKLRVRDNADWLLYRIVARGLASDSRITWQLPESADTTIPIYGTVYRLTHGDQFHGGSGISGMLAPLMLGSHRKGVRQAALHNPYDWLAMGHWHDYWTGKGLIVNGAVRGFDEYAYMSNFAPQRPTQAFWVTTPEHGLCFTAPIFADDRKAEGW